MTNGYVFREYIGAQFTGVQFSDVPVNTGVSFYFILAFAIDYLASKSSPPAPTNGVFTPFWDTANLSPAAISATKAAHPNLSIMVGLGGDSVQNTGVKAAFAPSSVDSWVANAVSSLSTMINQYGLDGVDVDYEHFGSAADVNTFVECIGRLLTQLKARFPNIKTSIAPFEDVTVQTYYQALWPVGQVLRRHRLRQLPVLRLRRQHGRRDLRDVLRPAGAQLPRLRLQAARQLRDREHHPAARAALAGARYRRRQGAAAAGQAAGVLHLVGG
uniref:Uncharacterized protein n=1 Tax=Avena sativa TaxID=4498 RepID=A0ACD5TLW2_AVESA